MEVRVVQQQGEPVPDGESGGAFEVEGCVEVEEQNVPALPMKGTDAIVQIGKTIFGVQ
jgi:hypothetical protein